MTQINLAVILIFILFLLGWTGLAELRAIRRDVRQLVQKKSKGDS